MWYVNDCQNRCQKIKKCAWWTVDIHEFQGIPQESCYLMEDSENKKKMPNSKDGSFSLY